jgi:hypothetical protein
VQLQLKKTGFPLIAGCFPLPARYEVESRRLHAFVSRAKACGRRAAGSGSPSAGSR